MDSGFDWLTNQLYNRWENMLRKKRKHDKAATSSGESVKIFVKMIVPYGCINRSPVIDDLEEAEKAKQILQVEYQRSEKDCTKIENLSSATFAAQR